MTRVMKRVLFACLLGSAGCSVLVDKKLDDKPSENTSPGDGDGDAMPDGSDGQDGSTEDGQDGSTEDGQDGGLTEDGSAEDGEPSDGTDDDLRRQVKLCVGNDHACGLFPNGTLKCWGSNSEAQRSLEAGPYAAVACGDYHTCALDEAGALRCVGRNRDGQRVTKVGPYEQVVAGDGHTCVLDDVGVASCWGKNDKGQSTPPDDVFSSLTAGEAFTCGVRRADQTVVCWGSDSSNRASPPADVKFVAIDAGRAHVCGRTAENTAVCWGEIEFVAPPLTKVTQVVSGNVVSCALLEDGTGRCWPSFRELPDPALGPYVNMAAGLDGACFAPATGNLVCYSQSSQIAPAPALFFDGI